MEIQIEITVFFLQYLQNTFRLFQAFLEKILHDFIQEFVLELRQHLDKKSEITPAIYSEIY